MLKGKWRHMHRQDKEALILIIIGILVVGATVIAEKKLTGYYPWGHPRTPIISTTK